jgi:hypothetical protein
MGKMRTSTSRVGRGVNHRESSRHLALTTNRSCDMAAPRCCVRIVQSTSATARNRGAFARRTCGPRLIEARWTSFTERTTPAAWQSLRPKPGTSRSTAQPPARRIRARQAMTRVNRSDCCHSRRCFEQGPSSFQGRKETRKEAVFSCAPRKRRSRRRLQRGSGGSHQTLDTGDLFPLGPSSPRFQGDGVLAERE